MPSAWKTFRRAVRRPFESAAFRFAVFLLPRLPRRSVCGLANAAGTLGFLFDRSNRSVGLANLTLAFGDSKTDAEKKEILRQSYITMALTFLDVLWFSRNTAARLEKYVSMADNTDVYFCNKGQICITAHFGNWEVLGQIVGMKGYPIHSIAIPVRNPDVDRLLIERRQVTGQVIVPRKGALRKLLSVLRNDGKVAFLTDQNTEENEGGIWVDFFGFPVLVTSAPAALGAKTGCDILMGFCRPTPGGYYHVYRSKTVELPQSSDRESVQKLTQQITSIIEDEIREHPECWLWTYKRWKKIRRPEDAERLPFYAE